MGHLRTCKCHSVTEEQNAYGGPLGAKAVEEIRDQIIITLDFPGSCKEGGETRHRVTS